MAAMRVVTAMTVTAMAAAVAASSAGATSVHSNKCHVQHTCPSDHASYRWKGLLCVKPNASERTGAFKRRVTYAGRVYYCKK
jgi:hypothetical protein